MEKDALLIERIDVFEPVEGLNAYDALLRAVVSFMEPFSPKSVRCRVPELFDELTALRFVRKGDAVRARPKRSCAISAAKVTAVQQDSSEKRVVVVGQAPPA